MRLVWVDPAGKGFLARADDEPETAEGSWEDRRRCRVFWQLGKRVGVATMPPHQVGFIDYHPGTDRVIVVQGFAAPGVSETVKHRALNSFEFRGVRPNPFSRHTSITFVLQQSGFVTLKVFDILGQEITTLVAHHLVAGNHTATWNASDVASGVYFCRLECGGLVAEKKLLLIR